MQDSSSAPLRNIYNIRYRCPSVNPRPPHDRIKSPIFAHDGAKPPIIRPAEVARGLPPPVRAGGWGGEKIKIKISHFCNTSPRTFVTKLDYSNTCKRHPFFFILSSIPQGRGGNAPARFLFSVRKRMAHPIATEPARKVHILRQKSTRRKQNQ